MMITLRIDAYHQQQVSEADIKADYTILNKHLRINELLHEYSRFFILCLLFILTIIEIIIISRIIITIINTIMMIIPMIIIPFMIIFFQRRPNDLPDSASAEARQDQSGTLHGCH